MRKSLLAVLCAVACAGSVSAEQLTPEQALARVSDKNIQGMKRTPSRALKPVYTSTEDGKNQFYIFNYPEEGYVVVSADDCVVPVLGYSDSGTFDPENTPSNMKAWLDEYARQIDWAISHNLTSGSRASENKNEIKPLVTSQWNQGAPYNNDCPDVNGKRTYTGCVATAMAQAMYKHKWPEKGVGSKSYKWNGKTLSVNFGNTTYDWANMTDTYNSSSSAAAKKAVANLMYSCGVGVEMDYGTDASGAPGVAVQNAFIQYFNYDKGVQYILRDYYGYEEWENIIYTDLANGMPVLYDGVTANSEGHEFVCDGYRDGYFHINWGWSGVSDGYFLLTALDPEDQGIGGSSSGYDFNQGATIGIKKPVQGSDYRPFMITISGFEADDKIYLKGSSIQFSGSFTNYSLIKVDASLGIKLTDSKGTAQYITGDVENGEFGIMDDWKLHGYNYFNIPASKIMALGAGTYTITPAYYNLSTHKWGDFRVPIMENQGYTAVVTASRVDLTPFVKTSSLKVSDLKLETPLYTNVKFRLSGKMSVKDQEYYGSIRAALFNPGSDKIFKKSANPLQIDVIPGREQELSYVSEFNTTFTGNYELAIIDDQDKIISDRITVTLQEGSSEDIQLEFSKITKVGGGILVPMENACFTGTVTSKAGYYVGPVLIGIFDNKTGSEVAEIETELITVNEGETVTYVTSGSVNGVTTGKLYIAAVIYDDEVLNNTQFLFKFTDASGIESVEDDIVVKVSPNPVTNFLNVTASEKDVRLIEVYSMSGTRVAHSDANSVDMSGLTPGLYIVRILIGDEYITKRVIKQ